MTKREQINRATVKVFVLVGALAVAVILFQSVVQALSLGSKALWLGLYVFCGILSIMIMGMFLMLVRCPDCRRPLVYSCLDRKMQNCPHCKSDWTGEVEKR